MLSRLWQWLNRPAGGSECRPRKPTVEALEDRLLLSGGVHHLSLAHHHRHAHPVAHGHHHHRRKHAHGSPAAGSLPGGQPGAAATGSNGWVGHLTSYMGGQEFHIDSTGMLDFRQSTYPTPGPWTPIPGVTHLTFASVSAVFGWPDASTFEGKIAVFAATTNNASDPAALYEIAYDVSSGTWRAPVRLTDHVLAFDATMDSDQWGAAGTKAYVFLTDQNHQLKEGVFDYQGNQLAGWQALGTQPFATVAATTTATQVLVNNEYQYLYTIHVFAVSPADHSVWYHLESAAPGAWTNLGGTANEIIAYESAPYALVAANNNGSWMHNLGSPDGSWSGWRPGNMIEPGEM
jgi:hypothetical protein